MKTLIENTIRELDKKHQHSLTIEKLVMGEEMLRENFNLSIINMCITYEAFISDLYEEIYKREPKYNHPWSNTRGIARDKNINIDGLYKLAHDAWDYYNTLKHINSSMESEQRKIIRKYSLDTPKKASMFVYDSLRNLISAFKIRN
ncbi:MAG: hypothetical protein KAG14_00930 [Mycoplasmataceae bacterium]|nr:hypothetical protein [Mycoplasmataceae bacterium]